MFDNIKDFASFIGFMIAASWMIVGAYVWLRWDYCGCIAIWARRHEFDEAVRKETFQTWR